MLVIVDENQYKKYKMDTEFLEWRISVSIVFCRVNPIGARMSLPL